MSLIWEAHNVIDRWREWSEHQHLSHDEFFTLVSDSDELQDRLLDAELAMHGERLAEAERENERLRKELRHPKFCTYDAEGKPITICHELATLRSEADRVHKEHAEMIDGYEAKLEEYERRIEELTEALELNPKDKHWIEGYRQGATDGAGEKP